MSYAERVRAAAVAFAEKLNQRANTKEQQDEASLAGQRLASFQPVIGGTLQCPECWVQYGSLAPLVAVPAAAPGAPPFRCEGCDFKL
jgi:hypothetical protein